MRRCVMMCVGSLQTGQATNPRHQLHDFEDAQHKGHPMCNMCHIKYVDSFGEAKKGWR
ncbi:E3 ubiquitin-protein ligase [Clarias magur]|uniref:E3 ubiquitin-protein ligase n=1 Tax=Clarias magur TaxID=1594786 RepID=A0A8J4XF16_CLAMG|nr:E3 ubiquitin-protein ligase [Clarias magur]